MKRFFIPLMVVLSFCLPAPAGQETRPEPATLAIGAKAPDFKLMGVDDKAYGLKDFASNKCLVVVFSCDHCPTAQAYEHPLIGRYY